MSPGPAEPLGTTVVRGWDQFTSTIRLPWMSWLAVTVLTGLVALPVAEAGSVIAMATLPRALATPIPTVTADRRASP